MNKKGFFTIILIIAYCSIYFSLIQQSLQDNSLLKKAAIEAIRAEKTDFIRTKIGISVEQIIRKTVKENLRLGNDDPFSIQASISKNLADYFQEIGSEKDISCNILDKIGLEKRRIDEKELSGLISVNVIDFWQTKLAEVTMHAGILKNLEPSCEIKAGNVSSFFGIPADYTLRIWEYEWAG